MYIDFANLGVLIPMIIITVILLVLGYITKKSIFPVITLLSYIAILVIHYITRTQYENILLNINIDMVALIASISSYLIIDEVEIRREKISEVFVNRYNKKQVKKADSEDKNSENK
jgi:hypothetical protein